MKVVKDAAIVIAAAALVATGVGVAGGFTLGMAFGAAADTIGGVVGLSAGLSEAIVTGAVLTTGLGVLQSILPKPNQGGDQTKWKADPFAGVPYAMGRTLASGNIVGKRGSGGNNTYEQFTTIVSLGPIKAFEASFANRTTLTFDGSGDVSSDFYHNRIWQRTQLGACPEALALTPGAGTYPGWTGTSKLSGLAATLVSMKYDASGKNTMTTEPQMGWIVQGVYVYDPRLDSTYPGGVGTCRALDESTYVWSEDPHLHGLTIALGRYQNGKRVFGIGAAVAQIDIASFVEGANLNDARGWKVGGQIVSRPDTPWNNLKTVLQAGGAQPVLVGGKISCINRAPRVSLATIARGDIVGDCSFSGTQPRRSRINGVLPMYRSEAHDWQMVSADPVIVPDYVAIDGDERTQEIQYQLVQQVDQAAQLAAYDVCDAREAGPGTVPLKPWWLNYRVGDCVTFNPEDGWSVKVIITGRSIDAQTGIVTYTIRSETDGKHAFALGQTGVAPPTASITYDTGVVAPGADSWTLAGASLSSSGGSVPALEVDGAIDNTNASAVLFELRPHIDGQDDDAGWEMVATETPGVTRKVITSVSPSTSYDVAVSYVVRGVIGDRLVLGPAVAGDLRTADTISTMIRNSYIKCATSPLVAADAGDGTGTITIADTTWDYPGAAAEVSRTGGTLTGIDLATRYYVYFDDPTLLEETPTYIATTSLAEASNSTSTPYRHNVGSVDVPAAGGGSTPGGGDAGGGSACPSPAMYLLAKGRGKVRAGALTTADYVWARHEITGVWDWYQISAIGPVTGPMYRATIGGQVYEATGSHLWELPGDRAWRQMAGIRGAQSIGDGDAVAIEVTDAHTYLLFASADDPVGVLSHNKLMNPIGD